MENRKYTKLFQRAKWRKLWLKKRRKENRVQTQICHINSRHPVYTHSFRKVSRANGKEKRTGLNFPRKCEEKNKRLATRQKQMVNGDREEGEP